MLYSEIISVSSQIHKNHIHMLRRQNVVFVNVKLVVHIVTTGLKKVDIRSSCCLPTSVNML
jgi:hypothetical protein